MAVQIRQTSRRRGRENWWDWEIHLEGPQEELESIEYVEYTLHETFPNPVRRRSNPRDGFKLKTSGWGVFTVYMRIHYKSGKDEIREHFLQFEP